MTGGDRVVEDHVYSGGADGGHAVLLEDAVDVEAETWTRLAPVNEPHRDARTSSHATPLHVRVASAVFHPPPTVTVVAAVAGCHVRCASLVGGSASCCCAEAARADAGCAVGAHGADFARNALGADGASGEIATVDVRLALVLDGVGAGWGLAGVAAGVGVDGVAIVALFAVCGLHDGVTTLDDLTSDVARTGRVTGGAAGGAIGAVVDDGVAVVTSFRAFFNAITTHRSAGRAEAARADAGCAVGAHGADFARNALGAGCDATVDVRFALVLDAIRAGCSCSATSSDCECRERHLRVIASGVLLSRGQAGAIARCLLVSTTVLD